jgi:hypothetical protein
MIKKINKEMAKSKKVYLITGLCIFGIEILIALFLRDSFIRPVFGDYLVVILLYCIVRTATNFSVKTSAFGVLIFSYILECLQGLNLLQTLGIKRNLFTDILFGSTFDWLDLLAYTCGVFTVLAMEYFFNKRVKPTDFD